MSLISITNLLTSLRPLKNNFVLRKVGDQALLYPVVNDVAALSAYITLNEIGLLIWQQLIVEEKTPQEVFSDILAEYECSEQELQTDSLAFLEELSAFMLQAH